MLTTADQGPIGHCPQFHLHTSTYHTLCYPALSLGCRQLSSLSSPVISVVNCCRSGPLHSYIQVGWARICRYAGIESCERVGAHVCRCVVSRYKISTYFEIREQLPSTWKMYIVWRWERTNSRQTNARKRQKPYIQRKEHLQENVRNRKKAYS